MLSEAGQKALSESGGKELLVTFYGAQEPDHRTSLQLGKALGCECVTLKEILSQGGFKFPPGQTRVAIQGHGDPAHLGSMAIGGLFYNSPEEFAGVLAGILKNNPQIKDIDLLSCNLGLVDEQGSCFAARVQAHLDKVGFPHVTINTFIVHNEKGLITDSMFVTGGESGGTLKADQFAIDLLRKDNQKLMQKSAELSKLDAQLFHLNVKIDLLSSIESVLRGGDVSLEKLVDSMKGKHYSGEQITRVLKENNVEVNLSDEEEDSITYNGKKFQFPKEAVREKDILANEMSRLAKKVAYESDVFSHLRSQDKNSRIISGEMSKIRDYIEPIRDVSQKMKHDQKPMVEPPASKGTYASLIPALKELSMSGVVSASMPAEPKPQALVPPMGAPALQQQAPPMGTPEPAKPKSGPDSEPPPDPPKL